MTRTNPLPRVRAIVAAAVLMFLASCILASEGLAKKDRAAWLFKPDHVTEIDLGLSPASREALAADPDEYVEGNFSLSRHDGRTYGPLLVGVRLKGTSSFRPLEGKAAFKLKFDEFVDGRIFRGLEKLTLNNMVQDPTMLHELLAYKAFRAMGLPAWRTGYSFVRVNGEAYGVYLNIETPDSVSLARWHPKTQHLYEGERGTDLMPEDIPEFGVDEGNEDNLTDLEALVAAAADWENIDAVADLEQMTRFWAVERYIGHWDGYAGDVDPNNYYLHSDERGRFTMLPWGTDQTWQYRYWKGMIPDYGDPGGLMFNRCLANPACSALYRDAVRDVRSKLGALDLDLLASDTAALLYPWQLIDPRRETTLQDMDEGIVALHHFIETRPVPQTTITRHPKKKLVTKKAKVKAKFKFQASETSSFRCKLNKKAWRDCASPKSYKVKAGKKHRFKVRATDAAGDTDATPGVWRWKVKRKSALAHR